MLTQNDRGDKIVDKNIETTITNMLKDLMEINIMWRKVGNIKMNQTEFLELKNTVSEIKISLEINERVGTKEEEKLMYWNVLEDTETNYKN